MNPTVGFLFDLDGVLIDSERRYTRIWQAIDDEFPSGIADFPRVIKGMTLHNILDRYYPAPEVHEAVMCRCLEAEKHLEYGWMPGAEKLLSELRERGAKLAMVTSSDNVKMEALRRKLPEIFGWFDAVVHGDMVTHGKPHPEPYLTGARLLALPATRCAVVEDALTGIEAGHRAGAYVIGMTDTPGREANAPVADLTCDTLSEINPDSVITLLQAR